MKLDYGFSDLKLLIDGNAVELPVLAAEITPPLEPGVDAVTRAVGLYQVPITTKEDLQVVLNLIEFRGALALVKTSFLVQGENATEFGACVVISVPDRDETETTINVSQHISFRKPLRMRDVLYAARDEIRRLLLHELAEGIVVAGIRPFDPHR